MYKEIITKDGSLTFFNEEIQDTYHSQSGAEEEAREKYAELTEKYLIDKDEIVIFDVCFGLGYNTSAAIDKISQKKLNILCFENDKGILQKIPFLKPSFNSYTLIREFINKFLLREDANLKNEKVELAMFFGDVQEEIMNADMNADYVFFDPFSPAKTPELWTLDFFKKIHSKMNKNALLFTYSYAKHVRENLREAGFEVTDGPTIGRRSPSTIARKK